MRRRGNNYSGARWAFSSRPRHRASEQTCARCGRRGTRGFTILSGTGDGTRGSWVCTSLTACEKRQRANPLPTAEVTP